MPPHEPAGAPLAATTEVLAEQGFAGTVAAARTRGAASSAEASRPLFPGKIDLFLTLFDGPAAWRLDDTSRKTLKWEACESSFAAFAKYQVPTTDAGDIGHA
ncbi:hypothetical protein ACIBF6_35730 [Streptosporangium amethystogenes]|uniref:hypothetical protein n=1 Tax=Streptosporangium amethystogenes TaxID=2002 RepID=UPI0037B4ACD3